MSVTPLALAEKTDGGVANPQVGVLRVERATATPCNDTTSSKCPQHFIQVKSEVKNYLVVSGLEEIFIFHRHVLTSHFQHAHFIPIVGVGKRGAY